MTNRGVQMPPADGYRLVPAEDIAEVLSVHPVTVRRWARQRLIPAVRLASGGWRFDPDEVAAWIRDRHRAAARVELETSLDEARRFDEGGLHATS